MSICGSLIRRIPSEGEGEHLYHQSIEGLDVEETHLPVEIGNEARGSESVYELCCVSSNK